MNIGMNNGIKKLIASTALSAALVFGAAPTASAYQYDRGDFTIGIMGTTIEMAIEMGHIDYQPDAPGVASEAMYEIPVARYDRLFNVNDVGSVFSGDTLNELSFTGYMGTAGVDGFYRGYFAVQDGWTNTGNPDTMITERTAISSFDASTNDSGFLHSDGIQGGFVTGPVGDRSIKWGVNDGIHNGFLNDTQPGHGQYGTFDGGDGGLELLASGGEYTMNIWMDGDDNYGYGQGWVDGEWDYEPTKLGYNVHVGVDEEGWVYAETAAVPVPAAVWLLGSGFLAMMGMRRRNNG